MSNTFRRRLGLVAKTVTGCVHRLGVRGVHLLLFSGFLGSGKTTLIVSLAKAAAGSGRKVALLVNEIGEVGIDNQLMRHLDLNVWELVAGCICCTMSGDLVVTIERLDVGYSPDLVIVEASGAADPRAVLSALRYYRGRPLSGLQTAVIVDPLRLGMLMEVMTPLITSQIEHADTIVISKTDIAGPEEVEFAVRSAQRINHKAKILQLTGRGRLEPELSQRLLPWPI
jgi:G3E family GTPase